MDSIPINDLSREDAKLAGQVADALLRVAASGWYLQGPERDAFESEFAAYLGSEHCVGVANGTDAIQLALTAAGCKPGDEVVTAANAGMYTCTAAVNAGLRPRFADVDPANLCVSADTIEAALTADTRAVVVTHLYGQMADMEAIVELCRPKGIKLLEDCAQATGAARNGRFAGTFGDVATFSFYPTKNLGTLGDAGAVVTSDSDVAGLVRKLGQYGWEAKYRAVARGGMNSRMDELHAAILRARLPYLPGWNERRRAIVGAYASALGARAGRMVAGTGEDYVAHLAVMATPTRDKARDALARAGVATEIHYPIPDHRQPVWGGRYDDVNLPVTEQSIDEILTLPCFPQMTDAEIDRVCEVLCEL